MVVVLQCFGFVMIVRLFGGFVVFVFGLCVWFGFVLFVIVVDFEFGCWGWGLLLVGFVL